MCETHNKSKLTFAFTPKHLNLHPNTSIFKHFLARVKTTSPNLAWLMFGRHKGKTDESLPQNSLTQKPAASWERSKSHLLSRLRVLDATMRPSQRSDIRVQVLSVRGRRPFADNRLERVEPGGNRGTLAARDKNKSP